MEPYLSIVIPAYNEERRLPPTLQRIHQFLAAQPYAWEVLISDDGSADATVQQAEALQRSLPLTILTAATNQGKGHAVRRGMLAATGQHILFTDADLSTPIEEVNRLLAAQEAGCDVAIGSRGLRESRLVVREQWYRELIGRTGNLLIQALATPGIFDTQCGFKLFRRDAARAIFSRSVINSICFDVELLYLARRLGYRIEEIPITWRHDPDSRIRIGRDGYRMIRDLLRIRRIHHGLCQEVRRSGGP